LTGCCVLWTETPLRYFLAGIVLEKNFSETLGIRMLNGSFGLGEKLYDILAY